MEEWKDGTGTKSLIDAGLTIPKRIERDLLLVPLKPVNSIAPRQDSISVEPMNKHHVLISGSRPEEVSLDARWESPSGDTFYAGVLTKNLVEGLRRATAETRYKDLIAEVLPSVRERSPQTPQFEGDIERPIFSTRQPDGTLTGVVLPAKPFALVTAVKGNRVTLNAGAIRGVTTGSMYDLFSPTEASFTGNPLAQMRIITVRPEESEGDIVESHFTIQPMCRAVESSHAYPPDKLYLQLQVTGDVTQTSAGLSAVPRVFDLSKSALTDALSKLTDMSVVDAEKYADVVLTVQVQEGKDVAGYVSTLTSGDGTVGDEVAASSAAELVEKLKPTLEKAFVLKQLLHFKNPNPPFKIEVWMDKGKHPVYQIGEVATFGFTSERDCYLTVLNVDTEGVVTMLFPNKYHPSNEIAANVNYTIPSPEMKFRIRAKAPAGKQLLKVIATTAPINLPELSLSRIHAPEDIFLAIGGSGEVRNLTKGLGRAFAVEAAKPGSGKPESAEIAHIPTSAIVTSELIATIVP
ncbi:DUF4384 domain-containing protein [Candidatus Poribacteria bacterium]|nr:DUF4384 domain-containing protein [Candidatus Poribacteria bacterium]